MSKPQRYLAIWAILGAASPALLAQPNRITARIDSSRTVVLSGRVPRLATAQNDAGAVESSFPLPAITLMLKPSAAQQADLSQLLIAQQDSTSASYHQWLTPEQYADRFGVSTGDVAKISAWLESQGFTVGYVARSRNFIAFSGTAQQVANAFHTQIHRYNANGKTHYANATAPSIPAALAGIVSGIRGLNDFRLKPRLKKAQPRTVLGRTTVVGPADFATIYNVNPLYGGGITGAGQKIAVVGQSDIVLADITKFRATFGLGAGTLTQVVVPRGFSGTGDPGLVPGDETESDLDIEWSGAVAKNATIVFVTSPDVWTSVQYAVEQMSAPVLSMSYGICEEYDLIDMDTFRAIAQQANLEGITMLAAAGDYAAADCDELNNTDPTVATGGLAVDVPGSFPEVTSMGGTQFNEGSTNYWPSGAAASYIPEIVWNDFPALGLVGGGGGGASVYFTQPPWQNGIAPNDGWRHVPDVSLASSDTHDPFYIYTSDTAFGPAGPGAVGGTSCAAPSMAGIVALVNQYVGSSSGLGNINPTLYRLSQTQDSGSPTFHDIVNGNNIVPCADSPDCTNGSLGWPALSGYDSASGLGSVDAFQLVHQWSTAIATQAAVVASLDQNPVYETATGSNVWSFTLTLNEEAGLGATLTSLTINGADLTAQIPTLFGSAAIGAHGSISAFYSLRALDVSNGPVNVLFQFKFTGSSGTWNTTMTVPFAGPQAQISINLTNQNQACQGVGNAASGQAAFAPGMLVSVYGTGMANFAEADTITPLPEYMAGFEAEVDGVPAPLLYVSPDQVNLQIPYETAAGQATLGIGNPYAVFDCNLTIGNAAPGIFTYADSSATRSPIGSGSARVGDTVAIYVTGVGQVDPVPDDGGTPLLNSNPPPKLPVTITVGGVTVAQPYDYLGIPNWSVGVAQINFRIPSGVAPGQQPVVVTVGNAQSLPANITIAQ